MSPKPNKVLHHVDLATGEEILELPQIKNSFNHKQFPLYASQWDNNKPDMTVPDQSITLKEMLDRHSKGMLINGQFNAIFDMDETAQGINPLTLDLTDMQELHILNAQEIETLRGKAIAEKAKRTAEANEARKKLQDEHIEAYLKRQKESVGEQ